MSRGFEERRKSPTEPQETTGEQNQGANFYVARRKADGALIVVTNKWLEMKGDLVSQVWRLDFQELRLLPVTLRDFRNVNFLLIESPGPVLLQEAARLSGDDSPPSEEVKGVESPSVGFRRVTS